MSITRISLRAFMHASARYVLDPSLRISPPMSLRQATIGLTVRHSCTMFRSSSPACSLFVTSDKTACLLFSYACMCLCYANAVLFCGWARPVRSKSWKCKHRPAKSLASGNWTLSWILACLQSSDVMFLHLSAAFLTFINHQQKRSETSQCWF